MINIGFEIFEFQLMVVNNQQWEIKKAALKTTFLLLNGMLRIRNFLNLPMRILFLDTSHPLWLFSFFVNNTKKNYSECPKNNHDASEV